MDSKALGASLSQLVAGTSVPVFLGGATAVRQAQAIRRAGAVALDDSIDAGVRRIAAQLAARKGKE